MKITSIKEHKSYIVKTDEDVFSYYRRNGPSDWETMRIDGWMQFFNSGELEKLFQEKMKESNESDKLGLSSHLQDLEVIARTIEDGQKYIKDFKKQAEALGIIIEEKESKS